MQNAMLDGVDIVAFERVFAGEHFIRDDAKRKQVAGRHNRLAPNLFRGHIKR